MCHIQVLTEEFFSFQHIYRETVDGTVNHIYFLILQLSLYNPPRPLVSLYHVHTLFITDMYTYFCVDYHDLLRLSFPQSYCHPKKGFYL